MLVIILLLEIALCWSICITSYHYDVTRYKHNFSFKIEKFCSENAVSWDFFCIV